MDTARDDVGSDRVGQRNEPRCLLMDAVGAEPGSANQPTVGPVLRLELPDAGIAFLPTFRNCRRGSVGGAASVGVQAVVPGSAREQEQCFPEAIELELVARVVADDVAAAGIPRQVELPLFRYLPAVDGVDGP